VLIFIRPLNDNTIDLIYRWGGGCSVRKTLQVVSLPCALVATSVLLEAPLPVEIPPRLPTLLLPDRIGSGLLPSPAIESDMR